MSSIIKKHAFGKRSVYDSTAKLDFISIGRVESVDDESDAGRIIVSIKGVDDKKSDEQKETTLAFPLLPKHLQVMPKVGEAVFVLKLNLNDTNYVDRYWIGPIISQPQKLNLDPFFFTAKAALPSGSVALAPSPSMKPEAKGIFPDKKYISIQGRNNSDIIFKDNEVLIRAGQHKIGTKLVFNNDNIGYFQVKYNAPISDKSNEAAKTYTVANIVAEKINLLTYKGTKNFNMANNNNLIDDAEMSRIINEAHALPYGDILVDFLEIARRFMKTHYHPYSGLPPTELSPEYNNLTKFDLKTINSKNIKID